jgi:hypothetical protein
VPQRRSSQRQKRQLLLAVNQLVCLGDVVLIGGCGFNTVSKTGLFIGSIMSLHANVPVVAHLGLLFFRSAFAGGVLGRGRCFDEGHVNDGALLEQQTPLCHNRVDLFDEPISQLVFFKQVTKVQDGGLVRNATTSQRQTCKLTHRLHVVERFFHGRITQRKPLLYKVIPKHRLERIRRSTAFAFDINRLNQRTQSCPRNPLIHFR